MEAHKEAGNAAFKRCDYRAALASWQAALALTSDDNMTQFIFALHNNCAMAYLRLGCWLQAKQSATDALSAQKVAALREKRVVGPDCIPLVKAFYRLTLANIALSDYENALCSCLSAAHLACGEDPSVVALSRVLENSPMIAGFRGRPCLPRNRAIEWTGFAELYAVGHDPITNILQPIMERGPGGELNLIRMPISITDAYFSHAERSTGKRAPNNVEEKLSDNNYEYSKRPISAYFGGVGDGRHVLGTLIAFGQEPLSASPGYTPTVIVSGVRLYLNDINIAALLRLVVLLTLLEDVSMCTDIRDAARSPLSESPSTRAAIFAYYSVWTSGLLQESVHKKVVRILKAIGSAQTEGVLPTWVVLSHDVALALKQAALSLMDETKGLTKEDLLRMHLERMQVAGFEKMKLCAETAVTGKLGESVMNRMSTEDVTREIESMPGCRADILYAHKHLCLPTPPDLPVHEPLFINPTRYSQNATKFHYFQYVEPRPDALASIDSFFFLPIKVKEANSLYELGAKIVANAAAGLAYIRSISVPLEVHIRMGDLSLDMDRLGMQGEQVDRITTSNVGDYIGTLNVLLSSSSLLRRSITSALSFGVLLAPPLWNDVKHYVWEYCRLHLHEVANVFGMHWLRGGIWDNADIVFGPTVGEPTTKDLSEDDYYGWLASLFLAIARPAQRPFMMRSLSLFSPASLALWVRCYDVAVSRNQTAANRVLLDILGNKLRSPYDYPSSLPEAAPKAEKRPAKDTWKAVNVAPYLYELRALLSVWPLRVGTDEEEYALLRAGFNRSGISVRMDCTFPAPDNYTEDGRQLFVSMHSACVSVAVITGHNAKSICDRWPEALLASSHNVHIFSVLEWDSQKHRVCLWLSFDDWQALQQAGMVGVVRPYRTDTRGWIRDAAPLSKLQLWRP